MSNEKSYLILLLSVVVLIISIMLDWGLRSRMIELQEWKTTYESGYCPTCGQPLDREGG